MEADMKVLTPGMEDYLEAILNLTKRDRVARVKDIAKSLGVTTPSVVSALSSLVQKNLVKHERYGYVELTEEGTEKAKEVDGQHKLLFTLLNEIMGVDPDTAYQDACKMEHHLSKETVHRIKQFISFLNEHKEDGSHFISKYREFLNREEMMKAKTKDEVLTLEDLKPGDKGKVIKIKGKGNLRKRLLDMGVIPGTEIHLKKVAPLGDPVDVIVKGYHLSLRKEEAKDVLIERSRTS